MEPHMGHGRFTIACSLVLILAAGNGFAALSRPSYLSASAMFSLFLLSLTIAVFGVLYRRGNSRAFWVGFLTCGVIYPVISFAPWFDGQIRPRLLTTAILDFLYPHIPALPSTTKPGSDPWVMWTGQPTDYPFSHPRAGFTDSALGKFTINVGFVSVNPGGHWTVTTESFYIIGHSVFGLIASISGAYSSRTFYQKGLSD